MAAVISVGVFALAAAGCGDGEGPATGHLTGVDAWLEDACRQGVDWRRALNVANQEFQVGLREAETPPAVQEVLLDFLRTGEDESAAVVRHFESVEPPPVEDGEAVARTLQAGYADAHEIFAEAVTDAEAFETDDPAAFQDEVRDLVGRVDEDLNAWPSPYQTALDEHRGIELREAFRAAPSCLTFSRGG